MNRRRSRAGRPLCRVSGWFWRVNAFTQKLICLSWSLPGRSPALTLSCPSCRLDRPQWTPGSAGIPSRGPQWYSSSFSVVVAALCRCSCDGAASSSWPLGTSRGRASSQDEFKRISSQRKLGGRRGLTVAVPGLREELLVLSPQPQGQGLCAFFLGTYAMQRGA